MNKRFDWTDLLGFSALCAVAGVALGLSLNATKEYNRGAFDHARGRVTVVTNVTNRVTFSVLPLSEKPDDVKKDLDSNP